MERTIAKNQYGLYSIPKEVEYTYTAQLILEGGVHEDTTIEYIQSVGGNIIHSGSGFGDFLPALKNCDKVGFTDIPKGFCFSTVKNDLKSAVDKYKKGLSA